MNKQHALHRKDAQAGSLHLLVAVGLFVLAIIGFTAWRVMNKTKTSTVSSNTATSTASSTNGPETVEEREPDSEDSLAKPSKVASADGKAYFYYGAPAGQNNKQVKRIVISLPGHETSAEDGYTAWSPHLSSLNGGTYALAEFSWWDGEGNETTDYYNPTDGTNQIRAFLKAQGYTTSDIVILHGFSRGSANTYAFAANDQKMGNPVFDAVISNSGKYETNFPVFASGLQPTLQDLTKYYAGIPWVLVCGGKDPNVGQSDCASMEQTKSFLETHKADVLTILEDPDEGHGAFHLSKLGLPKQAIELIEAAL